MAKNKDGFEPGAFVSNEELYALLAKQRQKPKKRGRPAKVEPDGADD